MIIFGSLAITNASFKIMDYYKILAIVSPFLSAILTGLITYNITMKGKRFDLLYQSKIPAFKDLSVALTNYKNFCTGRVAFYEGNEYSPYWEEGTGTLRHRTEIAEVSSMNSIYFSLKTRKSIEDLLNSMAGLCVAEFQIVLKNELLCLKESYFDMYEKTETCINEIYAELNLKP